MRTWKPSDYWAYWCSDMLAPPLASTVSSVMSLGFTARQTIPIVFFGFCICSVVITLTGRVSHGAMFYLIEVSLKKYTDGCNIPYSISGHRQKHVRYAWKLSRNLYPSLRRRHVSVKSQPYKKGKLTSSRWTAILCVQAGAFLQNCLQAIWPSFRNFPNHLPESAGITCKKFTNFM
jgi:hypothetical protein